MTGPGSKAIVARDQVRLGAGRCLGLALSGMSYRMFRSGITIAILALAVAFVAHMLSFGLLQQTTEQGASEELLHTRRLGQEITRLTVPDPTRAVLAALAAGDRARLQEYQRWSGREMQELEPACQVARALAELEAYFAELPVAARAVLVGDQTAEELFDRLSRESELSRFLRQVGELGIKPPFGDAGRLSRLLRLERPALLELSGLITEGQRRAIEQVKQAFPGQAPSELIAHPPPALSAALRAAGYAIEPARLVELAAFAGRAEDYKTLNGLLLNGETAASVARETGADLGKVNLELLAEYVDTERRSQWLARLLRAAGAAARLDARRLHSLFAAYRQERKLSRAVGEQTLNPGHRGLLGLSPRNQWLIGLSFLVCIVGVANAMLMSVTERFTEIATMKCLGAMDRFVMMMFVFEAVIEGAVGGLMGLALGGLLALLRAAVDYGSLLGGATGAAGPVALALLASLLVGMGLAAIAAVGPALVASRLAPMEAMRVE
jgi:putative ABC transport system permease protein